MFNCKSICLADLILEAYNVMLGDKMIEEIIAFVIPFIGATLGTYELLRFRHSHITKRSKEIIKATSITREGERY